MPRFARVLCALAGGALILLGVYIGFVVRPFGWQQFGVVLGLFCAGGELGDGAVSARWPLPTTWFFP